MNQLDPFLRCEIPIAGIGIAGAGCPLIVIQERNGRDQEGRHDYTSPNGESRGTTLGNAFMESLAEVSIALAPTAGSCEVNLQQLVSTAVGSGHIVAAFGLDKMITAHNVEIMCF